MQGRLTEGALPKLVVVTALVTTGLGAMALGYFVVTSDVASSDPGIVVAPATPQWPPPRELPTTRLDGTNAYLEVRSSARPLLLLVLDTECPACMENMANWQSLARELGASANGVPQTIVLSISPMAETVSYLNAYTVPNADVHLIEQWALSALSVTGTPTTLAFEPATGELVQWVGVLSEGDLEAIRRWAEAVSVGSGATPARQMHD
jgi:hypothetical protein